jgi:hypothetical protein
MCDRGDAKASPTASPLHGAFAEIHSDLYVIFIDVCGLLRASQEGGRLHSQWAGDTLLDGDVEHRAAGRLDDSAQPFGVDAVLERGAQPRQVQLIRHRGGLHRTIADLAPPGVAGTAL